MRRPMAYRSTTVETVAALTVEAKIVEETVTEAKKEVKHFP